MIIWDQEHKIEHFIRQAEIRTDNPDLGFLVPTPETPQLVEVDPGIFRLAGEIARPELVQEVVYHTPLDVFGPILRGPMALIALPYVSLLTGMSNRENTPDIISEQDVAGYHAAVLAAEDATMLTNWLKQNGYSSTPEIETWLKPYIAAKWKITAFKLIKPKPLDSTMINKDNPIITHAIRMSFATYRPFFPYSEPSDKQRAHAASPLGRALRIALLSSGRMQGSLGSNKSWPGKLFFSGSPEPASTSAWKASDWLTLSKLQGNLTLPDNLTYWRDESNPRPGTTDLYFSMAADQSSFRKTEIDYSLPVLNLFNFSNPLSDLAGLLIAVLLPAAPLYCGWRVISLNREKGVSAGKTTEKTHSLIAPNRILGFFGALFGIIYCLGCVIVATLLHHMADDMPGRPLPAVCDPTVSLAIALFFCTLIYCGTCAFRHGPAHTNPYVHRGTLGRYLAYLMSAGSILIGAAFLFAVVTIFLINFS